MAQLCPATKEALQRSDKWKTVADRLDPGALLRLIQLTCSHGNDKDYYLEIVLLPHFFLLAPFIVAVDMSVMDLVTIIYKAKKHN